MRLVKTFITMTLGLAWGFGQPASALDQNGVSTDSDALQEITVTAQRKTESAQSVPIAIVAFSADELKAIGATSSQDLPLLVPGLTLQASGPVSSVTLRGVGSSAGGTQSVLYFIDGAYDPYNYGHTAFNNVASVEIDKGPQGTLFGRNATGGIIQINTKDPPFSPTADIDVGYGNYKTQSGSLYASDGVTNHLAGDVAAYYNNQKSGWGTNLYNGTPTYLSKDVALRTKWLYQPFDATAIRFTVEYSTSTGSIGADLQPATNRGYLFAEATGLPFAITGNYNFDSNYAPLWETRKLGSTFRVDQDFNDSFHVVSITAWHSLRSDLNIDYDGTPYNSLNVHRHYDQRAESQEFQLRSNNTANFNWVVGAFFFNETGSQADPIDIFGDLAPYVFGNPSPIVPFRVHASSRDTSYAVFGQSVITIAPDTRLTMGARYTIDQIYLNGNLAYGGDGVIPGTSGVESVQYQKPTFRIGLDHSFTPNLLTYASFNTGYNSGVLNQPSFGGFAPGADNPVAPEYIDAYEVGAKTEWWNQRLRLNASAFIYHYTNLQQLLYEGGGLVTVNAGKANMRGLDLDLAVRPIGNLTLSAGAELLLATYADYAGGPVYNTTPGGALYSVAGNDSGKLVSGAPRRTANVRADYLIPTSFGNFSTTATAFYSSLQYADPSDYWAQNSYYLLNLSETWTSIDEHTRVSVWGKNLNNAVYDVNVNMLAPVGPIGNPGAPRTYGVTIGYHF